MTEKKGISIKTKKILAGIGIGFGTVLVFMISFFIAFSLIVNPINFMTVSDADTLEENKDLKEQVQVLEDQVDVLEASVEKYKASANTQPIIIETPVTTTPSDTTQTGESDEGKADEGQDVAEEPDQGFAPETVTSTDEQTPEDLEDPVTVIDISE